VPVGERLYGNIVPSLPDVALLSMELVSCAVREGATVDCAVMYSIHIRNHVKYIISNDFTFALNIAAALLYSRNTFKTGHSVIAGVREKVTFQGIGDCSFCYPGYTGTGRVGQADVLVGLGVGDAVYCVHDA
jgi:hypothetical protein